MRNVRVVLIISTLCLLIFGFRFKDDLFLISKNLDIFASLYKEVTINYVEETNPSRLMHAGIDGMLNELDPYTEYIPESEIEEYKLKYVSTQYGGIGASTVFIEGEWYINDLLENYPAEKQGLRSGDHLLKINEVAVSGKDRPQLSQLLRGPKGSMVKLTLKRDDQVFQKNLVREEIKQLNVSYSGLLANQIGYIKLDKFLENAGTEVKDALTGLQKQGIQSLILDLRGNGGGILQEAVKILNLFLPENVLVVSQKGKNAAKNVNYKTLMKPIAADLPLIVLINAASASAAEIVAGSLQDLDRAVVLGERSFGKGLVQQTFNLPYNSLVKVTVAKYYTPSGRCIQALDYAHRSKEGLVQAFADSSQRIFLTQGGRNVNDGNGISPDIYVESERLSPFTSSVLAKNLSFPFVNNYQKKHPQKPVIRNFQLKETDMQDFLKSLASKDLTYRTKADVLLEDLEKQLKADPAAKVLSAEISSMKQQLVLSRSQAMQSHYPELKRMLEQQIMNRYSYHKGQIEQGFQYDKALQQSIELLNAPGRMLTILKGEGEFKYIGRHAHNVKQETN